MHSWIFRGGSVQDSRGIKLVEDTIFDANSLFAETMSNRLSNESTVDKTAMWMRSRFTVQEAKASDALLLDATLFLYSNKSVIIPAPFPLEESTVDTSRLHAYGNEVMVNGGPAVDDEDEDDTEDTEDTVTFTLIHTTP